MPGLTTFQKKLVPLKGFETGQLFKHVTFCLSQATKQARDILKTRRRTQTQFKYIKVRKRAEKRQENKKTRKQKDKKTKRQKDKKTKRQKG